MKTKSTEIIATRDKLSKDITKYWNILRTENLIPKGFERHYDLKNLLGEIEEMGTKRIQAKLDNLLINLGFTKRSEFPKNSIYPTIFELSEKQEQFVQLGLIKYIDPKLKLKRGKKNMASEESLTYAFINARRNALQLEINGLKKKLEDFNNNTELDVASAYMHLAA